MQLSNSDLQLMELFLSELSDRFGNDGCNDFEIPKNILTDDFIESYNNYLATQDAEYLHVSKSKNMTNNTMLVHYLRSKITK